jgi:biopolymer transport protein ExbD
MAGIMTAGNNTTRTKPCKHQVRIDMTPMFDLGFLLITFFIFTTSMAAPMATNLFMPKDGPKTNVSDATVLSVLLAGENKIYYYDGKWDNSFNSHQVLLTTYNLSSGLGKVIRDKQNQMANRKNDLMLLIKPSDESSYNNLINTLDETTINGVKKYSLMDLSLEEKSFLRSLKVNQ